MAPAAGASITIRFSGTAVLTKSPPADRVCEAIGDPIGAPVTPSNMRTAPSPPGPGAVMMSARPSPVTSPAATRTPPVNAGA